MRKHSRQDRRRAGLSIIEVLIALVLVAVGILGIAGASALALRTATASTLEHRAQRRAELRIAELSARGCGGASAGGDSAVSVFDRWSLTTIANGGALLDEVVSWPASGGTRRLIFHTALIC